LFGPELSVLIVTDGQDYALLAPSRDHKRVGDGSTGPNTGGMGAYAPVDLDDATAVRIDAEIVTPVLAELNRRDIPFRGVLYAGLMLTADGPRVLEFNTRFGDPEAQVVLPLIQGDFLELLHATARGALGDYLQGLPDAEVPGPATWPGHGMIDWTRHCVVVVGASSGYPGRYATGVALRLPPDEPDRWIIHAGTTEREGRVVTAGGRVFGAVAEAHSLAAARRAAYEHLERVEGEGLHWRRDIAHI
jgi:phosphoribosylamine--glycine ligase